MKVVITFFSLLSVCTFSLFAQPVLACDESDSLQLTSVSKTEPVKTKEKLTIHLKTKKAATIKPTETTDKDDPIIEAEETAQLNIEVLKKRLSKTSAIGFFSKLAIRNDLVDLMRSIKKYRKKSILENKLGELRASFDGLLLKIVALLDEDPDLSRDLYVGREMIWQSLLEVKA